jgi:hypothetical protein
MCAMYSDDCVPPRGFAIVDNESSDVTKCFAERQIYYVVPIPGETAWSRKLYQSSHARREVPEETAPHDVTEGKLKRKRNTLDEDCLESNYPDENMNSNINTAEGSGSLPKKVKTKEVGDVSDASLASGDLNLPLKDEIDPPVIVKVYGGECNYKINDVVEFIGRVQVVYYKHLVWVEGAVTCLFLPLSPTHRN